MSYQPGDWIADKYQLIESIGGGGMGEIFKAEHALMHRTVAIKILHKEITGSAEMIERFKREATSAAAIEHANNCTVLDFDLTADNDFYLVMEYLEGETLKKRIHEKGVIPPKDAVFIMQQLLSVLQCAHDLGIVHRDIKPDNIILINRDNTNNFVKLLDFGIAHRDNNSAITDKEEGTSLTQAGFIYGTPEYIAPEQANGQTIDHRVDLYACGIILYEMLTGVVPFQSDSIINVLHQQIYAEPPHIDTEHIKNGAQFDAIIQKLLAKKPEDRFQSAREVTEALQEIVFDTNNTLKIDPLSNNVPTLINIIPPTILNKIPQNHIKLYLTIAGGVIAAIIGIIIIALVASNDSPTQDSPAPIPEKVDISQAQDPETAKPLEEILDIQPFVYDADFSVIQDKTLFMDHNLAEASLAFYQKDYQTCYDNIMAVHDRYYKHPNYLRLRMQAAEKMANIKNAPPIDPLIEMILADFIEITQTVPDAARNEGVLNAIQFAFKKDPEKAIDTIKSNASSKLATAMAWTIIYSPYDDNKERKNNMFEALDALPKDDIPEWQNKTLDAWRLDRAKCKDREVIIKDALHSDASKNDLFYGILTPLYNHLRLNDQNKPKETFCGKTWNKQDCNYCMSDWIIDGYQTWSALAEENKLDEATIAFLDQPANSKKSNKKSKRSKDNKGNNGNLEKELFNLFK